MFSLLYIFVWTMQNAQGTLRDSLDYQDFFVCLFKKSLPTEDVPPKDSLFREITLLLQKMNKTEKINSNLSSLKTCGYTIV